MLLEFRCTNHKSIKEEILFSMLAGSDNSHIENVEKINDLHVLKAAVIYGANGSGKTNFIDAISFAKYLVMNSVQFQPGNGIPQRPHKLCGYETDSAYQFQFIIEDQRFAFGFSLKNMLISEEYLYYFPHGRQTKIYERIGEEVTEGRSFKNKFTNCYDVLRPNRLMLSCAANFSSIKEIQSAYRFFSEKVVIYSSFNQENWMNYSLHQIYQSAKVKSIVLEMLEALGTGIKDIRVSIKKETADMTQLPGFLSDEFKMMLSEKQLDHITAKVVYDKFETDLLAEESAGIRKLFGILCPFIDVMVNGKALFCDELESNLHEALLYGLVRQFVAMHTEHPAQLVFTTHETGLLNLDLFRRDQIWFTEINNQDRSTDLYSLAEIRNVRKDENFGKGYIAGKYGAIPMLNLNFADIITGR